MPDIASLVARVSIVLSVVAAFPPALEAEPVRLDAGWELITDPGATLQAASLPAGGWRPAESACRGTRSLRTCGIMSASPGIARP